MNFNESGIWAAVAADAPLSVWSRVLFEKAPKVPKMAQYGAQATFTEEIAPALGHLCGFDIEFFYSMGFDRQQAQKVTNLRPIWASKRVAKQAEFGRSFSNFLPKYQKWVFFTVPKPLTTEK